MKSRVVLAMSGGVDSSVAAHLLLRRGYQVIGLFMRHGAATVSRCETPRSGDLPVLDSRPHRQGCCTAADALDARRVADRLGIPFYALDFQHGFERIMDYFVDEYVSGRTPNPCVMCNNWLKFGMLFDYADQLGASHVATGHYARLAEPSQRQLLRGVDAAKDQSYVLFGIDRQRLSRMLLPVGEYRKPEVRQMAANLGLRVADKRDSQEICFVDRGGHSDFVASRRVRRDTAGELVTTSGRVVGRHTGIEHFTVGQRRGLGVALGQRHYVVRIEPESRRVILGRREELGCVELTADRCNWLLDPPVEPFPCQVQFRYQSAPVSAVVHPAADQLRVVFQRPAVGVAPGQAVVCYLEQRVLGGGWIRETLGEPVGA